MWEYVMVLCIVTSFGGDPVNKCYKKESKETFPREKICEAAAKAEDYRTFYTLKDRRVEGLYVIRTFCTEVEKKGA